VTVDRAGGTKEKKEANKASEAIKKDYTKRMQKKKAKLNLQALVRNLTKLIPLSKPRNPVKNSSPMQ